MITLQKRLYAYVIDYLFGSIFISVIPMIITSIITGEKAFTVRSFTSIPVLWQIVSAGIALAASVFYFIIYPMNREHLGQTVGKRIMKIKIGTSSGERLTCAHMLRRELIGSMLIEGETAFPSAFVRYFVYQFLGTAVSGVLQTASLMISLGSVLWAVFGKEHRMFHDYIGKTVVVEMDKGNLPASADSR